MGLLVDYEQAKGDKAKALAAIEVAKHKNAKQRAWNWADTAVKHAQAAGVNNAQDLVVSGRYPGTDALEAAVRAL